MASRDKNLNIKKNLILPDILRMLLLTSTLPVDVRACLPVVLSAGSGALVHLPLPALLHHRLCGTTFV